MIAASTASTGSSRETNVSLMATQCPAHEGRGVTDENGRKRAAKDNKRRRRLPQRARRRALEQLREQDDGDRRRQANDRGVLEP